MSTLHKENPVAEHDVISLKDLTAERERLARANQETLRCINAIDTVIEHLNLRNGAAPADTTEKIWGLPPAPDEDTVKAGSWEARIIEAIGTGASMSGDIWRYIRDQYSLPDDKRATFYSQLSRLRKEEKITRADDGSYSLHQSLPEVTRPKNKKTKHKKPGKKHARTLDTLPRNFWDREISIAIAGGASTMPEIWSAIQANSGIVDEKKAAFYPALARMRALKLVSRVGDDHRLSPKGRKAAALEATPEGE